MICHGNLTEHCCWIEGQVCPFLEENTVPGRRWACGLYRELGSWDKVHSDPRYLASPAARFFITRYPGFGCGDWPQNIPGLLDEVGVRLHPDAVCCWRDN
jgi:hypothetical protein